MSDFSTREFEISALAFFLQKPQYFAQKRAGIKDIRFDDKKVQNILRQLHTSFEQYQEFPTKHELKEKLKSYLTDKAQYLDLEWQEYEDLVDDVYSRPVTGNTGEQVNLKLADQQRSRLVDKLANAKTEDLAIVAKELEGDLKGFRRLHYQEVDLGLNFFSKGGVATTVKLIGDYNEGICIPSGFVHLDQAMKGGTRKGELNVVLGSTGLGKAQSLDSQVLTPNGFVRMRDLQVGDLVVDMHGNAVPVTGVFPQGTKKVYKVSFSDGTSTECCDEHLWWVRNFSSCKKDYTVLPLKSFMHNLKSKVKNQGDRRNFQIPVNKECSAFTSKTYYIDPYVLGCILGDGSITQKAVNYTCADTELVGRIRDLLSDDIELSKTNTSRNISYGFVKSERGWKRNPYRAELERLGVFGCNSETKFVPEEYLLGDAEQRLSLLQGLMDTDGHAMGNTRKLRVTDSGPSVDYCCKSIRLVEAVEYLVRSLGGLAWRQPSRFVEGVEYPRTYFTIPSCPFRLQRKVEKWSPRRNKFTKMVDSVEYVGDKECQCISVDSPTSSYLTDDFIVTHNTTTLLNFTKGFVQSGARVCHIYLDSLEEEMATRMASCWLGQSIEYGTDLEQIGQMLEVYAYEHENKLFTCQFPGFSISAHDVDEFLTNLKSYLYQIDKENGVYEDQCGVIDVLVLDYMDLLVYDGNVEGFMVDEHKAGELNAVAIKHKIGIWTGTQGGTNAMKSDKPKLHDAHGYKSRFHPVANVLIVCCPEEERFLLTRRFTFDFGKARRPVEFSSIPFIMDVCTQCIYEDPERVPNIKTGKDTPDQNEYQVKGTPAKALPSGAVAGAFV